MHIKIAEFLRTLPKMSSVALLIIGATIGVLSVKVYPNLATQVQTWQAQITGPSCTPLPFDNLYMTKKIYLYVNDHAKAFGNLAGCVPRKPGCVEDESVWDPSQLGSADQEYKDRFNKPLPVPLTAGGLKSAMQSVFNLRNNLYSKVYSFEGREFTSCPVPDIEIVDRGKFYSTEISSPYHKKIQVDIQRILFEKRNLYVVTFYVHQKENLELGVTAATDWRTPWLVMENVKPEEVMYEIYSLKGVPVNLGGIERGKYPNYFKN